MTKEVEVGDEFTGKVVKTTTFGAFVELSKGNDGLLHISNVKPGERVDTVEDVLNRGDEIDVRVVEVDRERGRVGLRLADDPDIAGKTAEELATVGTGDKGPRGARRPRRAADGAPRDARSAAARARAQRSVLWYASSAVTGSARAGAEPAPDNQARLGHPGRHRAVPAVRSIALGFWVRTGSRDETPRRRGSRTSSSTCCSRAPTASARSRSTRPSTRWAPRSTPARARRPPRSTPASSTPSRARLRRDPGHGPAARPTRTSTPSARW